MDCRIKSGNDEEGHQRNSLSPACFIILLRVPGRCEISH
jgi:hypothetical protein